MIGDLGLWNVDNRTTRVWSTLCVRDVAEDELSSLKPDHWISSLSREYFVPIRSYPHNAWRIEEVFNWIGRAVENFALHTNFT